MFSCILIETALPARPIVGVLTIETLTWPLGALPTTTLPSGNWPDRLVMVHVMSPLAAAVVTPVMGTVILTSVNKPLAAEVVKSRRNS
ncbi:hypothetical protein Daudx_2160 [Candidatus Desulforudis audaxviator]|nr:hypothetical protein Daudx_2160 [Candidatus Desulforudis audaxviator]